jgi:2-polyprenyl-3-methyl-5-hydroxy-6-metoxy-1,4-benzoquinol methylase
MATVRSCPVCGEQRTRVLFRPTASPGAVTKCLTCGMVYIAMIEDHRALIFDGPVTYGQTDPKVLSSSNLSDVKDSWEFKFFPDKECEWPALQQNAIDAITRIDFNANIPLRERRIFDFGSGWGFFLAVAKDRGWTTYGLEPLLASAVYARAKFGLNIITDTLRENTFPPDFFDVITSFQVFEHLPYPKEDVQHLHKMLRQHGILYIEVPNVETWTMRVMRSHQRHFVQDHLNFFSGETLGHLLANHGFRVVDRFYPTRRMSIRHLVKHWFRRYLPKFMADALQNALERTSLWERTIGMNIGDIVTVVARKL